MAKVDAEMHDTTFAPPTTARSFPPLLNGVSSRETSTRPASQQASRETSVIARVTHQLNLSSAPSEESESDDENSGLKAVITKPRLDYASLPTGLCYDARMRFHTELDPPKDRSDYHPEDPRRIFWIYRTLCQAGLVNEPNLTVAPLVKQPLKRIGARHASRDEILTVHSESHFEQVKRTAGLDEATLVEEEVLMDSVYFNKSTYITALLSAGAAIETCLAVAAGVEVKNAIAVIRPPGHHAIKDHSMGFCHFDNVAVAARAVQKAHEDIRKILIVDWDVHHGNGIQQAFEDDPNVLYVSIHVHENGNFYPQGPYGDHLHCGIGDGLGKNINIPWKVKGMGDADYLYAFQNVVMPIAIDFNPDFVIIAAGFDAAAGDQLGGCFVTPQCYAHMTHMLKGLANGKIVACLEGGYNLASISKSALAVTETLMGEAPPKIPQTAATRSAIEVVRTVVAQQSKYWKCLMPWDRTADFDGLSGVERMHDVIRNYQSNRLYYNHQMMELWIYRDTISKSFENQVLATSDYADGKPLLVIFHDPPEVVGKLNPVSGKLALHDIQMSDVLQKYIAWAIRHDFGVIDVNVPKYLTGISDPDGPEEFEKGKVEHATNELAIYLWENYIECNDTKQVIFLGVGDAYRGLLHILNTRTWERVGQFVGIVGFVSENPLRPVTETFIPDFGKYYNKRSLIFVENAHPVWDPERKKPSKKFGRLQKSPVNGLNRMMWEHKREVERFWLERCNMPPDEEDVELERPNAFMSPGKLNILAKQPSRGSDVDGDTIMVASREGVA